MHLGFYTDCLSRSQTGIEQVTHTLISELVKQGNLLTLFHRKDSKHPSFKGVCHHLFRKNVPVPFYPSVASLFRSSCYEKVDLMHFTTAQMCYGKRPKVPIVITVYDMTPLLFPQFHSRRTWLFFRYFYKRYLQEADALIAISAATKNDLLDCFSLPKEKVVVIPPVFPFAPIATPRKSEKMILYLGTLEPRKNVLGLIEAFSLLKKRGFSYQLILAGKKGWDYAPIFAKIQELKVQDSVTYLGYVSKEKKQKLLRDAEVFVYPSFYEGFGIPLLEAMSCGTPVVTSNISSMPEVVGDAGVYVDPKSPKSIAEGILQIILGDTQAWQQKALRQASSFSSQKMVSQIQTLYQELLPCKTQVNIRSSPSQR